MGNCNGLKDKKGLACFSCDGEDENKGRMDLQNWEVIEYRNQMSASISQDQDPYYGMPQSPHESNTTLSLRNYQSDALILQLQGEVQKLQRQLQEKDQHFNRQISQLLDNIAMLNNEKYEQKIQSQVSTPTSTPTMKVGEKLRQLGQSQAQKLSGEDYNEPDLPNIQEQIEPPCTHEGSMLDNSPDSSNGIEKTGKIDGSQFKNTTAHSSLWQKSQTYPNNRKQSGTQLNKKCEMLMIPSQEQSDDSNDCNALLDDDAKLQQNSIPSVPSGVIEGLQHSSAISMFVTDSPNSPTAIIHNRTSQSNSVKRKDIQSDIRQS